MGEQSVDGTRADELDIELEARRIVEQVRRVADARAVLIGAVDDGYDGLRILASVGADVVGCADSRIWQRADLDRCLLEAERHPLHFTDRRSVTYVALADDARAALPGLGTLLVPLIGADGALLGVLSADRPVDPRSLPDSACELLEVYAGQARLALHHRRERAVLAEQLRVARAIHTIVEQTTSQPDVPSVLAALVTAAVDVLQVRAAWVCSEQTPGGHADVSSYPEEVTDLLGADICDVVEPAVSICRAEDRLLTEADDEVLAKVAANAGHERVLLAAIGGGTPRGAFMVFRSSEEPAWSETERAAALAIGRSLGAVLHDVYGRDHDRRLVDELHDLDRYKRDLVASISHDLKSPLTAITLNAEILETDAPAGGEGAAQISAIRRSADHLSRLVDDLLALARAEETPFGPAAEVDVAVLVREACQSVELEAQQRDITVTVAVPEVLTVPVDGDSLRRVFAQVVANAVKFSLPGGQVRVSLRGVGSVMEFSCADDGIGIPDTDQRAVFDMFRRADDPRVRVVPGTGMGLAIAHRTVSRLGGSIEVDSVLGRGAAFTVRVPAHAR